MPATRTKPRLTRRQQDFIRAYVGNAKGNAAMAARLAGYSLRSARTVGPETLSNPVIRAEIDRLLAESGQNPADILTRIGRIASLDARDFITLDPSTGKPSFDGRKAEAAGVLDLVQELIPTEHGVRVKFPSRLEALALAGKCLGMLQDRVRVEHVTDEPAIRERIATKLARAASGSTN